MDLDLKSRTAVVTGASIGIGRAIAKALALEGVRVVAVARRNDLLEKLAQEALAEGGAAVIPVVQDITQEDAAKKLAAAALAAVGHVGILVNNAASMPRLRRRPRFMPGRRDYPARSERTALRSTAFHPAES